jgi:hypothetical protein
MDTTASTYIFDNGYGRMITIRGEFPKTITLTIDSEKEEHRRKTWEDNCGVPEVDTTGKDK